MLSIDRHAEPATLVVLIPGVGTYELYHGWESGTDTWIDGKVVFATTQPPLDLDIACTSDETVTDSLLRSAVIAAWNKGSMYAVPPENGSVLTLMVPTQVLTDANVIEALTRFHP